MLTDHVFQRLDVFHALLWCMQMSSTQVAEVSSQVKLAYLLVVVLKGEAGGHIRFTSVEVGHFNLS